MVITIHKLPVGSFTFLQRLSGTELLDLTETLYTKCVHFFEGDDISVAFLMPVLVHLDWFLNTPLSSWSASTDEAYEHSINLFISALNRRPKKHSDEDLLRVTYRLTLFGQVGFKDHGEDRTRSD
jgi:hypothetical protein